MARLQADLDAVARLQAEATDMPMRLQVFSNRLRSDLWFEGAPQSQLEDAREAAQICSQQFDELARWLGRLQEFMAEATNYTAARFGDVDYDRSIRTEATELRRHLEAKLDLIRELSAWGT